MVHMCAGQASVGTCIAVRMHVHVCVDARAEQASRRVQGRRGSAARSDRVGVERHAAWAWAGR